MHFSWSDDLLDTSERDRRRTMKVVEQVPWPSFEELDAALVAYLSEITERVIREEVHGATGDVDEFDEPPKISQ